jgi:hypothetical protein
VVMVIVYVVDASCAASYCNYSVNHAYINAVCIAIAIVLHGPSTIEPMYDVWYELGAGVQHFGLTGKVQST